MKLSDNLYVGKLVRLAAPCPDDHEVMAKWSTNMEFWRMLDSDPARPYDAEYYSNETKEMKQDKNIVLFRLRTLDDDKLIGFADLYLHWNAQSCILALAIGDPDYWNRGFGTDAMRLLVNYAFRELNLYRVGLNVFSYNERAIHVYEKVGFVHEGRQRAALYRDGQRFDLMFMSVLRPEWEERLRQGGES